MSPPARSAAVVFDIDDTLVDFTRATRAALAGWTATLGIDGETAYRVWRELESEHFPPYTQGRISFTEQRRRRCRGFCRALGLPVPRTGWAADAWYRRYRHRFDAELRLFPDVLPTLTALAVRGMTIAAISNGSHRQQDRKLRRLGVRSRLRALVCCDDAGGVGKPAPAIFRVACTVLRTLPGQVVYVGDQLDSDARAAAAAGLRGIWLDRSGRGSTGPAGVPVLHRLDRLPALLTEVEAR